MIHCDKIISDLNCNIIIQDDFEEGFVYLYILLYNGDLCIMLSFIKEYEEQQVIFQDKLDGYYTLCTIKVPIDDTLPYYFNSGRFYKLTGEEIEYLELIDVNPEVSNLEILYDYYFSTCRLRKCFINYCRQIFDSKTSSRCSTYDRSNTFNRDLIWSILQCISYLVDFEQYDEAQRLLDRIQGCNGLCKELKGGECGCT